MERWAQVVSSLELRLEATRKMLEAVRTIGQLIESHPELADDLLASFQQPHPLHAEDSEPEEPEEETDQAEPTDASASHGSLFERVCALLLSRNNESMSSPQIARELGTVRGAVSHVLYSSPWKESFEAIKRPGHARNVYWKLTDEELQRREAGGDQGQYREERPAVN
jgi:hypothetical protein